MTRRNPTKAERDNPESLSKYSKRRQRRNKNGGPVGKGSNRRPCLVGSDEYRRRYDAIDWGKGEAG